MLTLHLNAQRSRLPSGTRESLEEGTCDQGRVLTPRSITTLLNKPLQQVLWHARPSAKEIDVIA